MSDQATKPEAEQFTIEELRHEHARVVRAAKQTEGAIVVDERGQRRFSIWIPPGTDD